MKKIIRIGRVIAVFGLIMILTVGIIIVLFCRRNKAAETVIPDDWRLILVNNTHALPEDYEISLTELSNGKKIDSRIYSDLQEMFDDARSEGIYPVVVEGYRTHGEQEQMMSEKIDSYKAEGYSKKEAEKLAEEWVAVPGTS